MDFMDFNSFKELLLFSKSKKEDNEKIGYSEFNFKVLWGEVNSRGAEIIYNKVVGLKNIFSSTTKHVMFSYDGKHAICFFEREDENEYFRVIILPKERIRAVLIDFKKIIGVNKEESLVEKFLKNRVLFSFKKYSVLSIPPTILSDEEILEEKEIILHPHETLNRIISRNWEIPNELFTRVYEVIRTLSIEKRLDLAHEFIDLLINSTVDQELKDYLLVLKIFIEYLYGMKNKFEENIETLKIIKEVPDSRVLLGLYYEELVEPVKAINEFNHFLSLQEKHRVPFLNFVSMFGLAKTYYRMKKIDLTIRYIVLAENFRPPKMKVFSSIVSTLLEKLLLGYIDATEFMVSNNVFDPEENKNTVFNVYNLVLTVLQYVGKLETEKQKRIISRLKTSLKVIKSMFQLAGKSTSFLTQINECLRPYNNLLKINCISSQFMLIKRKKINSITIVLNDGRIIWDKKLDKRTYSGYEELLSGALSAIAGIIEEASGEGPKEIVIPTGGKMFVLAVSDPFILIVEGHAFEKDIREFARNLLSIIQYYIPAEITTQWTGNSEELVLPENTIITMIRDFEEEK